MPSINRRVILAIKTENVTTPMTRTEKKYSQNLIKFSLQNVMPDKQSNLLSIRTKIFGIDKGKFENCVANLAQKVMPAILVK
jgi:hypothetical protein